MSASASISKPKPAKAAVASEEHHKVVTEGQLKWAQFHFKRRAQEVKQKTEELWQQPASVSDVDGALSDDGNTTEESGLSVVEDDKGEARLVARRNPKKKKQRQNKASVSRGRRALLRVSKRAFAQRREEIEKHGFRCGSDDIPLSDDDASAGCSSNEADDEALAAKFADENAWKKARRKRRQSRRRKTQSTEQDRLRRFENAFRAMMKSLQASQQPQHPEIATPTKVWSRPEHMPSLLSIDGRQYQDLKWGVTASHEKVAHFMTTTDFANMPVDRRASWLVHIPSKPHNQQGYGTAGNHHGYMTTPVEGLIPENSQANGQKDMPTHLGSEKFNEIVGTLQQQALTAQQRMEYEQQLRERYQGNAALSKWNVDTGAQPIHSSDIGAPFNDEDEDEHGELPDEFNPDSLKSIAAQYLTEFMANADEEHLIAVLGEKYRDDVESLVEAASDPGGSKSASTVVLDSKDIVRRYLEALQQSESTIKKRDSPEKGGEDENSSDEEADDEEEDQKSLHRDQMASFAGIAARYLAEVSRSRPVQRPIELHREQQGVAVTELREFLENLSKNDESLMASASPIDHVSGLPQNEKANQRRFESILAQYLTAKGVVDCNKAYIVSELQLRDGREFSKLVTQYLTGIQQSATALKKERDSSKLNFAANTASCGNVASRYLETIAPTKKETANDNVSGSTIGVPAAPENEDQQVFEEIAVEYLEEAKNTSDEASAEMRKGSYETNDIYAELRKETRRGFSKLVTKYMKSLINSAAAKKKEADQNPLASEDRASPTVQTVFSDEGALQDRLGVPSEEELANQRTFEAISARYLAAVHGNLDEDTVFEELGKQHHRCFSRIAVNYLSEMLELPGEAVQHELRVAQSKGVVARYLESLEGYPNNQHAILDPKEQRQVETLEKISSQYLAALFPDLSSKNIHETVVSELRRPEREGFLKLVTGYLAAVNNAVLEEYGSLSDSKSAVSLAESNVSMHLQNWRSRFDKSKPIDEESNPLVSPQVKREEASTDFQSYSVSAGGSKTTGKSVAARYISNIVDDCEDDDIFAELRAQDSPGFERHEQETVSEEKNETNDLAVPSDETKYEFPAIEPKSSDAGQSPRATAEDHIEASMVRETARRCFAKIRVDCSGQEIVHSLGNLRNCEEDRKGFCQGISNLLSGVSEGSVRRRVDKRSRDSASRQLAAIRGLGELDDSGIVESSFAHESPVISAAVNILLETSGEGNSSLFASALTRLGQEDAEQLSGIIFGYLDGSLVIHDDEAEKADGTFSQVESDIFENVRKAKVSENAVNLGIPSFHDKASTTMKSRARGSLETKQDQGVLKNTCDSNSNRQDHQYHRDPYSEEKKLPDQQSRPSSVERNGVAAGTTAQEDSDSENFPFVASSFDPNNEMVDKHDKQIQSPSRSFATNSEFSPDRLRDFHNSVMERSALIGQGESGQTIIDTDGTTSEASDAMSPRNLAGLMLTPAILTKRHRQAINAIKGRKWEQATYLLSANPWLAEMPEIGTNQYLLHKLAMFGAGDSRYPPAPEQLCTDLVKLFPAVQKFDENGNLPLHMASRARNLTMIKLLGERFTSGASVRNEDGMLPLHLAIAGFGKESLDTDVSAFEPIKVLLGYFPGALAVSDNLGNLPIHTAAKFLDGDIGVECIELLLDEAEKQLNDPDGVRFHNKTKVDDAESVSGTTVSGTSGSETGEAAIDDDNLHCTMVVNDSGDTPLTMAVKRSATFDLTQALLVGPGGKEAALMQDFQMNNALHLLLGKDRMEVSAVKSLLKVAPEAALERNVDHMLPIEIACLKGATPEVVLELVLVDLPMSIDDKACLQPTQGGESWWYLACECKDNYLKVVEDLISMCTYQQVQELCFMSRTGTDETVVSCASPECGEFLRVSLLYVGRYELLGSETATQSPGIKMIEALDYGTADTPLEEGRRVTLNCFVREELYTEKVKKGFGGLPMKKLSMCRYHPSHASNFAAFFYS